MLERIFTRLEALADRLPETIDDCSGDLLCQRRGVRHKQECIGKTINFTTYVRGLRNI